MKIKCPAFPGNKPAVIASINVKENDHVNKGDDLFQVETGKGNRPVKSPVSGVVKKVLVKPMDPATIDAEVMEIEEEKTASIKQEVVECPALPGVPPFTIGLFLVNVGDQVKKGQEVYNLETMKGSNTIKSGFDGKIVEILVQQGDKVNPGDALYVIDAEVEEVVDDNTPKDIKKDIVVVGGGPGGYIAAIYAAQNGESACVIEEKELGGTCLNVGCIPTKTLVKSSEVYKECKNSEIFGIGCNDVSVNMKAVIRRKNEVRQTLIDGIHFLMQKHDIQVIKGHAVFKSPTTLHVDGVGDIIGRDVILASGSCVSSVPIPGLDLPMVMDSNKALDCDELPESITIIGGGVIGMEFACIYNNLGVKVHVIEFMDRLVNMVDHEASDELLRMVQEEGIHVSLKSKVTKILETENGGAVVMYEQDGKEHATSSEKVLCAIGRKPNVENMNLEALNLKMKKNGRGLEVSDYMETGIDHLYAIGDVTDIMQLAHVASHQAVIAVDKILGIKKKLYYYAVPNVIFTDPEIASVGYTEEACIKNGIEYMTSRFDFTGNGKALTMNQNKGFVKLIIDKNTRKLIGGTIMGPDASSLIASLGVGIENGLGIEAYMETIFAHPTTSEAIHESALGFGKGSLHS